MRKGGSRGEKGSPYILFWPACLLAVQALLQQVDEVLICVAPQESTVFADVCVAAV